MTNDEYDAQIRANLRPIAAQPETERAERLAAELDIDTYLRIDHYIGLLETGRRWLPQDKRMDAMRLSHLRQLLPGIEIDDDPYSIGYWLRWAGQERSPRWSGEKQEGYDQADQEIAWGCRNNGPIVVGASSRVDA